MNPEPPREIAIGTPTLSDLTGTKWQIVSL